MARIIRLSRGKLPAKAVAAIYREIMSSSRAAQGQAPVGILRESAATIVLPGRWCLGACDEFSARRTWAELATGLETGTLALALLTGKDLMCALGALPARSKFFQRFAVEGDLAAVTGAKVPLAERIFIVTPRRTGGAGAVNRIVILIECKSTINAVKSLVKSMPDRRIHAEQMSVRASPRGTSAVLARLSLASAVDGARMVRQMTLAAKSTGLHLSILGMYPSPEDYGG